MTNREALTGELESVLVKLDGEAICEKLLKAGVPAGPVLDTAQMYHHEHTKYREMAVSKDWYKMSGIPIKLSRTPGSIRSLPPKFGEHGRDILAEAGYEAGEIDALVEGGTVLEQRRS